MTRGAPPWSPRKTSLAPVDLHGNRSDVLQRFKKRIEDNDPVALYQAIFHCNGNKIDVPDWLTERLLQVISGYYLGKKPGKKGGTNSPLPKLGKQIEREIRHRAVKSVREWQKDRTKYHLMPRKSIEAWFENETVKHSEHRTVGQALRIARIGLTGLRVREAGTLIKCSEITLKRALYDKELSVAPMVPVEAAVAFGFNNPEEFFGTDMAMPPNLK